MVVPAYNEVKCIRESVEWIARGQTVMPDALVVVDNNSTDETADIVQDLQAQYPFIHLLSEAQKGTGAASRTGFRFAIDEVGADIVARTDADTAPRPSWCAAIVSYFKKHPHKVTAAGIATARKDEFYRPGEFAVVPVSMLAYRGINAIRRRSALPLLTPHGHNLAVRSEAYDAVGGFMPTSIEEQDEDQVLFKKLYEMYGRRSAGFNPRMIVHISMRRNRTVGTKGIIAYYDNMDPDITPGERARRRLELCDGDIDIR